MSRPKRSAPTVTWVYGLLGLIPFATGAVLAATGSDAVRTGARRGLLIYGGLILSFLGGGRWGLEIGRERVRAPVISASMLPAVGGFLCLLLPKSRSREKMAALAAGFVAQGVWDVRSQDTPAWYPGLRTVLTAGAVGALLTAIAAQT